MSNITLRRRLKIWVTSLFPKGETEQRSNPPPKVETYVPAESKKSSRPEPNKSIRKLWAVLKNKCINLSANDLDILERDAKQLSTDIRSISPVKIEKDSYSISLNLVSDPLNLNNLLPKAFCDSINGIVDVCDKAIANRISMVNPNPTLFDDEMREEAYFVLGSLTPQSRILLQNNMQKIVTILEILHKTLPNSTIKTEGESIKIGILYENFKTLKNILIQQIKNKNDFTENPSVSAEVQKISESNVNAKPLLSSKDLIEVERRKIIVNWYLQHLFDEIYKLNGCRSNIGNKPEKFEIEDFDTKAANNTSNLLWKKYQIIRKLENCLTEDTPPADILTKFNGILAENDNQATLIKFRKYKIFLKFFKYCSHGELFLQLLQVIAPRTAPSLRHSG